MEIINLNFNEEKYFEEELSLCIGYFDGLHLGHQQLINAALKSPYKSAILTFDFSTSSFYKHKEEIINLEDKTLIAESLGIEYFFVLSFSDDIKNLSKEEFINFLLKRLNIKNIIVGEDFTFAKNKSGNVEDLKKIGENKYTIEVIEEYYHQGNIVHTSYIIDLIHQGKMELVYELLSRYYFIKGKVNNGYGLGKTKNVPTANISLGNYVVPYKGVYACFIEIDKKIYTGMANVGIHPTINQLNQSILEVNIFDFNENLYDKEIIIYFVKHTRDEMKFASVEDLYLQLEKDKKEINQLFNDLRNQTMSIIPFEGTKEFKFNDLFALIKHQYHVEDDKITLIGPSYENDKTLIKMNLKDIYLDFDQETEKLVQIEIFNNNYGILNNGICIEMEKEKALMIDPSIKEAECGDLYYSSNGYLIIFMDNKVNQIILVEKEFFKDLIFFNDKRDEKDYLKYMQFEALFRKYLNDITNEELEKDVVLLAGKDLTILYHNINNLSKKDILKMGKFYTRLVHTFNEFKDYETDEYEILRSIVNLINKKVKN